jgi:hypothetical protein
MTSGPAFGKRLREPAALVACASRSTKLCAEPAPEVLEAGFTVRKRAPPIEARVDTQ